MLFVIIGYLNNLIKNEFNEVNPKSWTKELKRLKGFTSKLKRRKLTPCYNWWYVQISKKSIWILTRNSEISGVNNVLNVISIQNIKKLTSIILIE